MKKFLTLFLLISCTAYAQDIHFTMFQAAPSVLNPAAAGVMKGNFRAMTNYRSQWFTISKPYNTFSFSVDGALFKNSWRNVYLGAGMYIYRDVAGSSRFGTTKASLSLSSIFTLNEDNVISGGIAAGWGQRSLSPSGMTWDAQFNGQEFDPTLPTNENLSFANTHFFDYSMGIMWAYGTPSTNMIANDEFYLQLGLAFHHLSRPKFPAYISESSPLFSKWALHTSMHIPVGMGGLALRPRVRTFLQGPALEVNAGLMVRYLLQEGSKYSRFNKGSAISFGGYYRVGDALAPSFEFEWAGLTLGFAYDFTFSKLTPANKGQGGPEVYLSFQNPNPFFRLSHRSRFR